MPSYLPQQEDKAGTVRPTYIASVPNSKWPDWRRDPELIVLPQYLESLPALESIIQHQLGPGVGSKRTRPEGETVRIWDDILHDQFPGRNGYSTGPEMPIKVDGVGKPDLLTARISQDGQFKETNFLSWSARPRGGSRRGSPRRASHS